MNSLQQLSSISKLLASGNYQKSDVYANDTHSFRDVSDSSDWGLMINILGKFEISQSGLIINH